MSPAHRAGGLPGIECDGHRQSIAGGARAGSAALAAKWDALFANQIGVEEFKGLAEETRAFLKQGLPQGRPKRPRRSCSRS
jgi:chemotaxis regulatin CheY-phosphate phosphatase CheZ